MKREYGQHCSVAKALDVVGSRWTLLIVRELLPGPRRFKDLLAGMPGMGTNLLTDRLRHLEHEGIIERRTLPPPAGSTVYELTEQGRELQSVLFELARWGSALMSDRRDSDAMQARWAVLAMLAGHSPEAAAGVDEVYEFRIDDDFFSVEVKDGNVRLLDGPAMSPDAVITTDTETFYGLGGGPDAIAGAVADGRLRSEGDPEAIRHCQEIFSPAVTAAAP